MTATPPPARFLVPAGTARRRRAAVPLAAAAAALALAACVSGGPPVAKVDEEAVKRYREQGYAVAPVATIGQRISAPPTEAPWTVSIVRPADHLAHPLVIYLASLGDDDAAPVQWIQSWAHAGYAVLSVQALPDDAQVWATADARSGDFERIARARYADELMADRIAGLARLLGEIHQRSARGEPGLDGLDWGHVALAGADLGAYTAQAIAAAPEALGSGGWTLAPAAYIVVSPYARRGAGPAPAGRAIAPVLMISARDDVDAYGVVSDPAIRHLAFDRLGPGEHYYFELGSVTHRWLEGDIQSALAPDAARRAAPGSWHDAPQGPGDRRRRGGDARDSMAPESDEEDAANSAEKKARLQARAGQEAVRARSLTQAARSVASFEAVSTAFLDAYVRRQPTARTWLLESAGSWLQNGDRLKHP